MSRDRFLLLLHFVHFDDNDLSDSSDPNRDLGIIWLLVDLIRVHYAAVYSPGRDLCVNEALVTFKGRLAFKQFI